MNCKEIEQKIYLYGELSEAELSQIEEHLPGCKSCRSQLEGVESKRKAIEHLASHTPAIRNSAALTSRIMQNISTKPTGLEHIGIGIKGVWQKITLTAISAALVLLFVQEQRQEPAISKGPVQSGAVLNSNLFRQLHQETRRKKESSVYGRLTYQRSLSKN